MDKEQEIRQQFLEEAQEYLGTIESAMLRLATSRASDMDAVLRAAHSIKGGAAMMGFETISHLAHRLEDFFKVIKARRTSLVIDTALESLLLQGVDCLERAIADSQDGQPTPETWLKTQVHPIFEQLHDRLGDLQAEDETALLLEEGGHDDMVILLFETEVEASLQRLEALAAEPDFLPHLAEVTTVLQELAGLGEMLEIPAFSNLCQSIERHLQSPTIALERLIPQSLELLRQSQTLILQGQPANLPHVLERFTTTPSEPSSPSSPTEEAVIASPAQEAAPPIGFPKLVVVDESDSLIHCELLDYDFLEDDSNSEDTIPEITVAIEATSPATEEHPTALALDPESTPETFVAPKKRPQDLNDSTGLEKSEVLFPSRFEAPESTVRVAVRQLDQLNDLFGELTIERNGLGLHLGRLRQLVNTLSFRMRALERSNSQLRTAYDRIATQTTGTAMIPTGSLIAAPRVSALIGSNSTRTEGNRWAEENHRFDSLEMDQYDDLHLLSQEVMETIVQVQEVTSDIEVSLDDADQTVRDLNRTSKQMQTSLTQVRMRPLADILNRFPRALREMCLQYNKKVELKVYGGGTLIDRIVLEALSDPLMHLLRNAFDHGIEDPLIRQAYDKPEQGTIEIRAAYRGSQTLITVSDDGGGIDLDKIRMKALRLGYDEESLNAASDRDLLELIFEPGFSTASQVTALSGRGVGMDVVRTNLRKVRGDIKVETQSGAGTTFTINVPFTLSVMRVLMVESLGLLLALPKDEIEEVLLFQPEVTVTTAGHEFLKWEEQMVPLIRLGQWLEFRCPHRSMETDDIPLIGEPMVLLLTWGNDLVAVQVDRCWGEQEVAIRQVDGSIPLPSGFAGCSILGNGRVVPLVDVPTLLARMIQAPNPAAEARNIPLQRPERSWERVRLEPAGQRQHSILVVDDSVVVRRYLAMTLEKAGYRVEQAKDGQDALEKLFGGLMVQAVICDIEMPRLDGYGLLNRVKADPRLKHLPISILTSRSGDKHRQLAMNLGAAAYFSKPFREQEVLQSLEQLILAQSV